MKRLMFTLVVVALSGSSLFGIHRYQTRPLVIRQPQSTGVTAYDDPNLQECLAEKGRTEQALQECRDEAAKRAHYDNEGKGVTHF